MSKPKYEDLPDRAWVGMMVLNKDGRVFIGRRPVDPRHRRRSRCRCRRPASTTARIIRSGLARSSPKSPDPFGDEVGEIDERAHRRHTEPDREPGLEGKISRREAEMVRLPFHRQREGNQLHRSAAISRNSSNGAGSRCDNLPLMIIRFKWRSYDRVVKEFARFAKVTRRSQSGFRVMMFVAGATVTSRCSTARFSCHSTRMPRTTRSRPETRPTEIRPDPKNEDRKCVFKDNTQLLLHRARSGQLRQAGNDLRLHLDPDL